jgi:hypothetical protein
MRCYLLWPKRQRTLCPTMLYPTTSFENLNAAGPLALQTRLLPGGGSGGARPREASSPVRETSSRSSKSILTGAALPGFEVTSFKSKASLTMDVRAGAAETSGLSPCRIRSSLDLSSPNCMAEHVY